MRSSTVGRACRWWPPLLSVLLAVLALGPALLPGVVLTYDMVFVPGHPFTPFVLGVGTPAPRAVPSDALVALASLLVPTDVVQKSILVLCLAGAGLGCARLARLALGEARPATLLAAETVAICAAQWNPFVAERLVLGQWTILLGLAVLPWALRAAVLADRPGGLLAVCGWIALAGTGGANTTLLVVVPTCFALLVTPARSRRLPALRALGAVATAAVVGAVWWLPAVVALNEARAVVEHARLRGPLGHLARTACHPRLRRRGVEPVGGPTRARLHARGGGDPGGSGRRPRVRTP